MGEKGGKAFSFPKSSIKSTPSQEAPLTGKDDSSIKSKKGRKVQFDSEGSSEFSYNSKSGGKSETVFSKGDGDKGGIGNKGSKEANGGKSSGAKESQPLELRLEKAYLQETYFAAVSVNPQRSNNSFLRMPNALWIARLHKFYKQSRNRWLYYLKIRPSKSLYHLTKDSSTLNLLATTRIQSVRQILETLTAHDVSDGEIFVIANVCTKTTEEVFALAPSLKRIMLEQPLNDVLRELAKFKETK